MSKAELAWNDVYPLLRVRQHGTVSYHCFRFHCIVYDSFMLSLLQQLQVDLKMSATQTVLHVHVAPSNTMTDRELTR